MVGSGWEVVPRFTSCSSQKSARLLASPYPSMRAGYKPSAGRRPRAPMGGRQEEPPSRLTRGSTVARQPADHPIAGALGRPRRLEQGGCPDPPEGKSVCLHSEIMIDTTMTLPPPHALQQGPRARRRHAIGFTLIELMVVLVLIGVLAALIVPNVLNRSDDPRPTAAQKVPAGTPGGLGKLYVINALSKRCNLPGLGPGLGHGSKPCMPTFTDARRLGPQQWPVARPSCLPPSGCVAGRRESRVHLTAPRGP